MTFDDAGNVSTTAAHLGMIRKVGKDGGEGKVRVKLRPPGLDRPQ